MAIEGLKPEKLWDIFAKICEIPHCSGNEKALGDYLLSFAEEKGIEADRDEAGNVVLRVPASEGHEDAPTAVLQGHLDMVCEKNEGTDHDFEKDPIVMERDGDWITAKGTTLGADNGVGLAAAMAIVDNEEVVHGPLEILATVSEEVGLVGAGKLKSGFLKGKTLLNLDSEEIGEVYIGCAGGGDNVLTLPVDFVDAPSGAAGVKVRITGLRGGHSGIDIIEQRGNAIKILTRIVARAADASGVHIGSIGGGSKRNAIPREAAAELAVEEGMAKVKEIADREIKDIAAELGNREKNLKVVVESMDAPEKVLDDKSMKTLIDLLLALPHGVEAMNYDIEGLVETSNNLATVSSKDGKVVIGTSTRSSIASALDALSERIAAAARLAGAEAEIEEPYPGWKPDLDSKILAVVKNVHKREFGEEPEMKAIHAGLECGIIGEKFPGMDMVSFGPWIEHPHSPDERINIPSVETFWKLLAAVLEEIA